MVTVKLSVKELPEITPMVLSAPDEEGLLTLATRVLRLQDAKTRLRFPRWHCDLAWRERTSTLGEEEKAMSILPIRTARSTLRAWQTS